MKNTRFPILALLASVGLFSLSGCEFLSGIVKGTGKGEASEGLGELVAGTLERLAQRDVVVNGNTVSYGDHRYSVVCELDPASREFKLPTAAVSFSNFPSSDVEFAAVYESLLGKSLAGTVAMVPMAIELFARDAEMGRRGFELLCSDAAIAARVVERLQARLSLSHDVHEEGCSCQRYMAAALLKGASDTNGYLPENPYTVEMTMAPGGVKDAAHACGKLTSTYILSLGWDAFQRGVDVFRPEDSEYYKILDCTSCCFWCKDIQGVWAGLQ